MIRRGLQFVFVWALLGAAPCFALPLPSVGSVVLIGGHHPFVNGEWVVVAQSVEGVRLMNRDLDTGELIGVNGSNEVMQEIALYGAGAPSWLASISAQGANFALWNSEIEDYETTLFPNAYAVWDEGAFGPGAPPDPYEENFPDWESAAVKIPLGFGFAMCFWAAAVAASIGMKWVRDLASAAS